MSGVAPTPSVRDDVLSYFHFFPGRGIIIAALVLFSLATVLCLAATIVTRRWYMLIAVAVGIMEIIGYAFRLTMLTKPVYGYYVGMQCLLIIPPSFLALVEYMTLAKVVQAVRDRNPGVKFFLRPKLITWLYFTAEIISLALQGAGAGLSVSQDGVNRNQSVGRALLIVGLVFLVVVIVCFLLNAVFVSVTKEYGVWQSRNLTYLFVVLYFTTTLLLIRNLFRLIEFAGGWYGRLAVQEKYFYTLDALMVLLILFTFSFAHYGFFLRAYMKEMDRKAPAQIAMV